MTDLSISEQRQRAGLSPSGRTIRRGPPKDIDRVRVDGEDYEVVGEDERAPDRTEEEERARREEWASQRRTMTDDMRAKRRLLPLVVRLARATARLQRLTNLRARPIASGGRSSEDSPGGRRPPGSDGTDFDRYTSIVAASIETFEHALDIEEGIAPGRSASLMGTTEKDRELFTLFAGVAAGEVPEVRPEQGSRATVYRRRRAAGFTTLGLDPETGLAPTPDRVNAAVVLLSQPPSRS